MSKTFVSLAAGDFLQDWSDAGLITTNNDWSNVAGIVGYLGNDVTSTVGVNPTTLTGPATGDVNAGRRAGCGRCWRSPSFPEILPDSKGGFGPLGQQHEAAAQRSTCYESSKPRRSRYPANPRTRLFALRAGGSPRRP